MACHCRQEIAALRHHLSLYEEALEDIEEEGDAKAAQIARETLYLAGIDPVQNNRDFTPADLHDGEAERIARFNDEFVPSCDEDGS